MHIHLEKSMLIGSDFPDCFGFLLTALDIIFLLQTASFTSVLGVCYTYIVFYICIHRCIYMSPNQIRRTHPISPVASDTLN